MIRNENADSMEIAVGGYTAIIDAADWELVRPFKWRVSVKENNRIYVRASGPGGCTIFMHRLIARTPAHLDTDHINGNCLDNRRANLRPATESQNGANTSKPRWADGRVPTSAYKGVYWETSARKWRASIRVNRRSRNLGRYNSEIQAAKAYDAAAVEAWGPFARTNFPSEVAK